MLSREEIVDQIKSLIDDRESLIDPKDDDCIFKKDKEALENILELFELDEAIIDKMSELMTSPIHSKAWVKNYFKEQVLKERK